jgi:hypothetical protein
VSERAPAAQIAALSHRGAPIQVAITPPPGLDRPDPDRPTWQQDSDATIPPTVTIRVDCNGACRPEAIRGNIEKAVASAKNLARQPHYGSRDPEKAAIRSDLEILHDDREGELHLLVFRIRHPKGFPVPDRLAIRGYLHRPGDAFFVEVQARAALDEEERWREPMIAAVRSASIVSPPRADATD